MEQLVRDTRIAQIYEGTNGVQAMDLVGRKLVKNRGAFVHSYLSEVRELIAEVQRDSGLSAMAQATANAADAIAQATDDLIAASAQDADEINAAAVDFLHAFGLFCYAHMWLLMLQAAQGKTDDFYDDKRRVAMFFFNRMLPELDMRLAFIRGGAAPLMALSSESF
jgi:hypothetical protein